MTYPYEEVFKRVELKLFELRSPNLDADVQLGKLEGFKKYGTRKLSDENYFHIMVKVVFYSGFRAKTVKAKEGVILKHFPDLNTTASYGEQDIENILGDPSMIRNRRKLNACVGNARLMQKLIKHSDKTGA